MNNRYQVAHGSPESSRLEDDDTDAGRSLFRENEDIRGFDGNASQYGDANPEQETRDAERTQRARDGEGTPDAVDETEEDVSDLVADEREEVAGDDPYDSGLMDVPRPPM